MPTDPESTSASWKSDVWVQAVRMTRVVPEADGKSRANGPAAVAKKLCQWAGSAVRSLIPHHSKAPTTARATGESQVSTFEARGVSVMF